MTAIITIADKFRNIFQRFSRFGTWFLEHQRRNLIAIFTLFILIAFGTTVLVTITPRPSNLPSTELNTPVSFGTLNKTASLKKVFLIKIMVFWNCIIQSLTELFLIKIWLILAKLNSLL